MSFTIVIRAKDQRIDSQELRVSLDFRSDKLPEFDLQEVEQQLKPLNCSSSDPAWRMKLPSLLDEATQVITTELVSPKDLFIYKDDIREVRVREGKEALVCNETEIKLQFNLTSNLLGSNIQELSIKVEKPEEEEKEEEEKQNPVEGNGFDINSLRKRISDLRDQAIYDEFGQSIIREDPKATIESIS